jgi:hypothetical protein
MRLPPSIALSWNQMTLTTLVGTKVIMPKEHRKVMWGRIPVATESLHVKWSSNNFCCHWLKHSNKHSVTQETQPECSSIPWNPEYSASISGKLSCFSLDSGLSTAPGHYLALFSPTSLSFAWLEI